MDLTKGDSGVSAGLIKFLVRTSAQKDCAILVGPAEKAADIIPGVKLLHHADNGWHVKVKHFYLVCLFLPVCLFLSVWLFSFLAHVTKVIMPPCNYEFHCNRLQTECLEGYVFNLSVILFTGGPYLSQGTQPQLWGPLPQTSAGGPTSDHSQWGGGGGWLLHCGFAGRMSCCLDL